MSASVSLRGKRRSPPPRSSSLRTRSMRSAVSARSITVKSGARPTARPCRRSSRLPTAWNVPPHTRPRRRSPVSRSARESISRAARRVNVRRRIRSGGTPRSTRRATRQASVQVLPLPAPATTRSGPPRCSTASRWRGLRRSSASNMRSSSLRDRAGRGKHRVRNGRWRASGASGGRLGWGAVIPLDPSPEQMREMGEAALAYAIEFLRSRGEAPASRFEEAEAIARSYRNSPPEVGGEFSALVELVDAIARNSADNAGPGFLAYIPGGGLFASSLADLLSTTIDRFVNLWGEAPVAAQIEDNVVRWLCDLFDYPPESRGVLTSGGSMANFSAIVSARKAKLPEDFLSGTLYVSEQAHASVAKAAMLAGFPVRNVRRVPVTPELRLDVDAARLMVEEDRAAGLEPFALVASAGTTNTGAVDPIAACADLAAEEDLWLHVDAAYGGFFQLTERGRARFRGIERADSITLDPHKGMFLPYGTGGLVVRDGARLRAAHHAGQAAYLQDLGEDGHLPNF